MRLDRFAHLGAAAGNAFRPSRWRGESAALVIIVVSAMRYPVLGSAAILSI
jgi:hypothetical protein